MNRSSAYYPFLANYKKAIKLFGVVYETGYNIIIVASCH